MNRTTIEWTNWTWNPVTGCNRHCEYCYAERMANRLKGRFGYPKVNPFTVTFHPKRLSEPSKVKKSSKIFVCSMGELFDKDSKYGWIDLVFAEIKRNPHHIFQILTKRPEVLSQFNFPENVWLGVSIDGMVVNPLSWKDHLLDSNASVKFISFEPLLKPAAIDLSGVDWVIVGAKTGRNGFVPPFEWVEDIIDHAKRANARIFLKNNLKLRFVLQQYPEVK